MECTYMVSQDLKLYPYSNNYRGGERQRIFQQVVSAMEKAILRKYPDLNKIVSKTSERFNYYQLEDTTFGIYLNHGDFRGSLITLGYQGKILARFTFKSWQDGLFRVNCFTPYEKIEFLSTEECLEITKLLSKLVYIPDTFKEAFYTYYVDNFYAEVFRSMGTPGCIIFGNEKDSLRFKSRDGSR